LGKSTYTRSEVHQQTGKITFGGWSKKGFLFFAAWLAGLGTKNTLDQVQPGWGLVGGGVGAHVERACGKNANTRGGAPY